MVLAIRLAGGSAKASSVRTPSWVLRRGQDPHGHAERITGVPAPTTTPASEHRIDNLLTRSDERSFLGVDGRREPFARPDSPGCCGGTGRVRAFFRRIFSPRRHALLTGLRRGTDDLERQVEKVGDFNARASAAFGNLRTLLMTYPGLECADLRLSQMRRKVEQPLDDARNTRRRVWVSAMHLTEALDRVKGMKGSTISQAEEDARTQISRASLVLETTNRLVDEMCILCPSSSLCGLTPLSS